MVTVSTGPAARAVGLTKSYGAGETQVTALDDVSVEFDSGRFIAIMGRSGSGKSTLMHVNAGLDSATSGKVYIGDVDLTALKDNDLTRLRRDAVGLRDRPKIRPSQLSGGQQQRARSRAGRRSCSLTSSARAREQAADRVR